MTDPCKYEKDIGALIQGFKDMKDAHTNMREEVKGELKDLRCKIERSIDRISSIAAIKAIGILAGIGLIGWLISTAAKAGPQ